MKKQNILAVAGYLVAALIVLEVGLRILGFGHPLLYRSSSAGYELVANQTSTRLGKTTRVNSLGLRGPETTPAPIAGVVRTLSIGDSVANGGTQISDRQTYPAQLQEELTRTGTKVEVLNASAGGWALENERNWLKEHGTYGASTIIWEINQEDLDQSYVDGSILGIIPSFPARYPTTAIGELLSRYILPKLGLVKPSIDPGSTDGGVNLAAEQRALDTVADVARFAKANNAKLVILYWDPHLRSPEAPTVAARGKLFAFASANDIPVVRPQLNLLPNWKTYFRDSMHPNAAGNVLIAKQLATAIGT